MFEAKEKGFAVGSYYCKGRENLIGTGSFAEVYLGFNTQTNEKVAIKVVDVKRLTKGNQKLTQYIGSEIQIMKALEHENIVRLYDVFFVCIPFCFGVKIDFIDHLNSQVKVISTWYSNTVLEGIYLAISRKQVLFLKPESSVS